MAKPVTWRALTPVWRGNPPPGFIRPWEPALVDRPPAGAGWLCVKRWRDGFRILSRKEGERVQVWSRCGADFTWSIPGEAPRRFAALNASEAPIDGDERGLRSAALGHAAIHSNGGPIDLTHKCVMSVSTQQWRFTP